MRAYLSVVLLSLLFFAGCGSNEVVLPKPDNPPVKVVGHKSVAFIIDTSGSMLDKLPGEALSKLDNAKLVLKGILMHFMGVEGVEAGLFSFDGDGRVEEQLGKIY